MIKLAVSGCCGRMGQRISALSLKDKSFKLSALLEGQARPDTPAKLHNVPVSFSNDALKGSNVLIEFTVPQATIANLKACVKHKVNMVIGMTGLDKKQIAEIKKASKKIAIVFSSNMSIGVNLVFSLIKRTAEVTGKNYEMSLVETHHIHKKDAPSGTAKTMAEIAEQYSKRDRKSVV